MAITFYHYPNCGTCKKAKKWLEQKGIEINDVHIVNSPPSKEELKVMVDTSGLELKKFFNTSGKKYRELNLKEKLPTMTEDEALELLSSDGMLIKRPITIGDDKVTVGFKEDLFEQTWK